MIRQRSLFCAFGVLFFVLGSCGSGAAENDWSVTLYGVRLLKGNLSDGTLLHEGFEDSYLVSLAVAKRVASYKEKIDLEVEGQAVKHFGDQKHWEFNILGAIRWLPFPWDKYIDTSFASGAGLSYATKTPEVEEERRGEGQTQKFLTYLMLELAFSLPQTPNWSLVTRVHHRSGAFGLFNGVTGASNGWGFGVKYTFETRGHDNTHHVMRALHE
jgi:hypothetical protein